MVVPLIIGTAWHRLGHQFFVAKGEKEGHMRCVYRNFIGLLVCTFLINGTSLAQEYLFTNFEPVSGFNETWGINNTNQVVGACFNCGGLTDSAWIFDGITFNFFRNTAGYPSTSARGINNLGDIAGFYTNDTGTISFGYLLRSGGRFQPVMDNVAPGGVQALGLNDQRTVVGDFTDVNSDMHGFSWTDPYHYKQLDPPGSISTIARGTNNNGQIVGWYKTLAPGKHAFLLQADGVTYVNPVDFPSGINTVAAGININGLVVGKYDDVNGSTHGFVWNSPQTDISQFSSFDVPGSAASGGFANGTNGGGINDAGRIVGIWDDPYGNTHGFQLMTLHAPYALTTTSKSCSAVSLTGGAYLDSYDSAVASYVDTLTPGAGADIATNGGATLNGGNTIVNGTLHTPAAPTDSCQPLTTSGGALVEGGVSLLVGAFTYANPPQSSPASPTTSLNYSAPTIQPIASPDANGFTPIIAYGNVTFQKNVNFAPGVYTFNSINAQGGVHLTIGDGPVVINLIGQNLGTKAALNLSGGSTFFVNGGNSKNLVITYAGQNPVQLSGGSMAAGFVYAPNARVTLSGGSGWSGAIVSSTYASSGSPLHYDVQLK
jgi:hypothetical protein